MSLNHHFNVFSSSLKKITKGGIRLDANCENFSALHGMALSYLTLEKKGFREPHWHPNANELSYCLEGEGVMTIFSPGDGHDTFTIQPGEIAFVPMGYLHHIENTGDRPLRMLVCFDAHAPEDLNLSSSIDAMPDHILADTFNQDASFFKPLKKGLEAVFIGVQETPEQPEFPSIPNRYKFNLERIAPQVSAKGGWVKLSNASMLKTLEGLAVYSVLLEHKGAREPHWHPNASELNFLVAGKARITLLSPGGKVETFDMKAGDISFLPKGYLHHIENIGENPAKFVIFFNNKQPNDIGISGCLGAYSNKLLSTLFDVSPDYFNLVPKFQEDLFIVGGG